MHLRGIACPRPDLEAKPTLALVAPAVPFPTCLMLR